LSAQGLRVDCVGTLEEALAHLQHSAYDVLLCDLHLSSGGYFMDGREAAGRILESAGAHKPLVIYMTGDLMESGQGIPARGEPGFLQKPFRIADVLAMVREVLAAAPAETSQS
jgi:CheY-like chemotaxis protein